MILLEQDPEYGANDARIEELHRAGRSAYAISKELGVSYGTVRARVKALEVGQSGEPSAATPHGQEP